MLALSDSNNPSHSSKFQRLFDEVTRSLVAIIETKHTIDPTERAAQMIERVIGCSRRGPSEGDPQPAVRLTRVAQCVAAARGLGFTEETILPLLCPIATLDSIERYSVPVLRASLEDLLVGQDEAIHSKLLEEWPTALFVFARLGGDPDTRLSLFGAYMRGFNYLDSSNSSRAIEEVLMFAGPLCRMKVSFAESATDFVTSWRTAPVESHASFSLRERAEMYRDIRPLFKAEDDPLKVSHICRAIASPHLTDGAGLKLLLAGSFTEHERRLLLFNWAALFEYERSLLTIPELSFSDPNTIKAGGVILERLKSTIAERSGSAVRNGMPIRDGRLRDTKSAYRIAAELCGVDLAQKPEWGALLISSKTFAQCALEAPELVPQLVERVSNRSVYELRQLMTQCDEALYRDALHRNSPQLLLELLPHLSREGKELPVMLSAIRTYQMETCGDMSARPKTGVYNLGLIDVDYGPPERIKVRDDFLFAWKFDPRFVDTITRYWREWWGVADGELTRHGSRSSARTDLVEYIHRYLTEHQHFYDTYRYLQGEQKRKGSFMFDDSPFPEGRARDQAYRETFEVMRRNYDLSLRLFTFLECECKHVPAHAESLVGRFLRQSFAEYSPTSDSVNRAFPGNGWKVKGLRLGDFGLTPQALQRLFQSRASVLSNLDDLHVLMTQGMVAIWCPNSSDTWVDGVPQAWVLFNRHYHPSGNCVGSLVDLPHFEHVLSLMEAQKEFIHAGDMATHLGSARKELGWMGNLSGTLSNSYSFDTGPFRGERLLAGNGLVGREPGGHVHKHYLLQKSLAGMGIEFQMGLQGFQDAHNDLYRSYSALHLLFNAGFLYPFSLFKKGFSVHSLRPEDHDQLARLDLDETPEINPHTLLMLLYAEDVQRAVRRGIMREGEASVLTYEDPLMIHRATPKIALDCGTLQVGTWGAGGWREIDDLNEYDWPQRARLFTHYFKEAFSSNSLDLKSISRRWIGL